MSNYNQNQLGYDPLPVFVSGMSWKAQLAQQIFSETGDKKMKDVLGEHKWNTDMIDKLIKLAATEMLPGADKYLFMSARAGVSIASAKSFYRNADKFRNKTRTVSVATEAAKLATKITGGVGDVIEGTGDFGKALPWIIGALAIGISGYLIFAGKRGVNLIPTLR